uniref:Uncharacterized protein n=1 Tax=Tanacetum cinerariifolium TaxID=118510 RepID=A0A699JCK5_TANCI|nr:hypothetical protein [Tanacetum cinerariifolium]
MGQDRQMQMIEGNGGNQFRQQLLIAQKEETRIQLQAEEYDLMAAIADLDEIKEVNANCILMANLQQASSSGTQTDSTLVYDSDGSAEVHEYENCYNNEIFNMFTQEEQYTELLEPIPEPQQVPQNDNNVISEVTDVEQGGKTVEQHPINFEETCTLYDSLYHNLAVEVEKVNSVNRKLKETNADLTTELARYKNQERCFEISQEKYDKLERCYQQSVYQEQCLSKRINALHLSTGKQILTLNEQISDLNKQLSKEKSTVSFLLEEKKKLKSDFKTCEDELLDKQIQLEKKIKELNNIVLKTGQSIQTIHMLSPKPNSFYHTEQKMALGYQNPFYLKQAQKKQQSLYDGKVLLAKHDPIVVHDSEETLQLAQESRQKMKQMNKEIKPANYTKINHLSGVFVPQTALSREELYFSNISKTANVSKSISIPNEDLSDDTTPIKELNNIVLKTGQSIQTIHMLSPKPNSFYHTEQKMALGYQNPFYLKEAQKKQQSLYDGEVLLEKHDPIVVHDSEETLQLAQESRQKMKQMNKEIKPANYTKINHLLGVFVPQTALSREELYFSNISKTANVSKSISIPNEDLSDDTTPSVARKFLNEIKSTIVTLQPKFVGDFKSLAKEADASLAKHKILELEIERLLKAVVSQDIISVVQNASVVDTSDLQTELERTKERFKNYIIKKETEYAKLWNDWYKKCDECKYDKISYDKAYKDMQQKIEWLQAQLRDLKGKSTDNVFNYARENAHLKATYKNLFDSISVSRIQTETKIASLQNELQCNIYKNAKLRTQLFKKVFDQKDNTQDLSKNTKFAKQPNVGILPKISETNALSKPVTSNSVSTPPVSKGVNNAKVIASGMFRISPDKVSRKAKKVPNIVSASSRTTPITVSQPNVITKKNANSNLNGLSSTGLDNTKTRRPQPRSNTKNDRVPSASKSSRNKNKEVKVEEHHRNLLLFKKNKHISSACNNSKTDSQDVISKVVCVVYRKCLNSVNHDVCLNNYVNGKKSRGKKHKANVSNDETQQKNQPEIKKPKKVKENQEKDKIGSKPDKNGKRVKAGKSLKQLQWIKEEKPKKTQKE